MTTATTTDKSIRYDRASRDWAAYLNGEYIGSFSTHAAAEAALDQVAYDQLADGVALTAAELDGGSDADTMAEEVAAAVEAPAAAVNPAGECEAYGCREQVTHEQISNRPWTDYAFCCYHFRMNVNGGTCTCGTPPPTRPGLIVAQGHGWRVECNRAGGSFSAIVNGVGCIGRAETPGGAQTLCNTFMARQRAA